MSIGIFFTGFAVLAAGVILSICLANTYHHKAAFALGVCTTVVFVHFLAVSTAYDSWKHLVLSAEHDDVVVVDYCLERTPTNELARLERDGYKLEFFKEEYRYDDQCNNRGMQRPYRTLYYVKEFSMKPTYEELSGRCE